MQRGVDSSSDSVAASQPTVAHCSSYDVSASAARGSSPSPPMPRRLPYATTRGSRPACRRRVSAAATSRARRATSTRMASQSTSSTPASSSRAGRGSAACCPASTTWTPTTLTRRASSSRRSPVTRSCAVGAWRSSTSTRASTRTCTTPSAAANRRPTTRAACPKPTRCHHSRNCSIPPANPNLRHRGSLLRSTTSIGGTRYGRRSRSATRTSRTTPRSGTAT